jgi:hypothetical protein
MAKQAESPTELADLSALADGRLDPRGRRAVKDRIAGSPHLRTLYERERVAVEVLRQAAAERAPARLRSRVVSQRASRGARTSPRYGALGVALAAAAAALAVLLPGGPEPSVSQAARLALRGPSGPAPFPDPGDPRMKLAGPLQGLYFPNWSGSLGWRPVGARTDRLGGHPAVTVYYRRGGMSVAYTIVGAPALARPSAPVTHAGGRALQALSLRGRTVVTWRRAGHTCVLSASAVPRRVLEQLADPAGARITE